MSDYIAAVKKYVPNADEAVLANMVKDLPAGPIQG